MMLTLDGSTLEGGGQLTRMALCLSAITNQSIRIHSIRAGRGPTSLRAADPNSNRKRSGRGHGRDHKPQSKRSGIDNSPQSTSKKGRPGGGLKESHLAALNWLAARSWADVEGAEIGSTEVRFWPGKLKGKFGPGVPSFDGTSALVLVGSDGVLRSTIELRNPGSVWLIFQAIFPYMVFGPWPDGKKSCSANDGDDGEEGGGVVVRADKDKETVQQRINRRLLYDITLKGGTNVPKSMSTEYVQQVFLPMCVKMGLPEVRIDSIKQGWTAGRLDVGEVRIRMYDRAVSSQSTTPDQDHGSSKFILPSFSFTQRGEITSISVTVLATARISAYLTPQLTTILASRFASSSSSAPEISVHSITDSKDDKRIYILLVATTSDGFKLGRDVLGNGGKTKTSKDEEKMLDGMINSVVSDLANEVEGDQCVDEFMQDQIVTFQALADGMSRVGMEGTSVIERDTVVVEEGKQESAALGDPGGSLHTRTVRWVCEEILSDYEVEFKKNGRCRGVAWNSENCKTVKENSRDLDPLEPSLDE